MISCVGCLWRQATCSPLAPSSASCSPTSIGSMKASSPFSASQQTQTHICQLRISQGQLDLTSYIPHEPPSQNQHRHLGARCSANTSKYWTNAELVDDHWHTPQCAKIAWEALGMRRQPVPVSGAGHALVNLVEKKNHWKLL